MHINTSHLINRSILQDTFLVAGITTCVEIISMFKVCLYYNITLTLRTCLWMDSVQVIY